MRRFALASFPWVLMGAGFVASAACLVGAAVVSMPVTTVASAQRCAALQGLRLEDTEILLAESVAAGRFTAPDGSIVEVPAFCRVRGEARPSADSRIGFEVWMPANTWNGRYYQLGNGGFAGYIHYPSLAAELRSGNAAASTDTGHQGGGFDASWARRHPQRIIDYGYRSLTATSHAANALIHAYFGKRTEHRYFAGCSNGGRQALMMAQRSPEDWDGIAVGAPAFDWTRQLATFAWLQRELLRPGHWIDARKLAAIQRAAIRSCTAGARVVDGIPEDPRLCHFDPTTLLCRGAETADCLTRSEIESLADIQHGPREPGSGRRIFFGFEPTGAAMPDGWNHWILNRQPAADDQRRFGQQFFRNFVLDDPSWQVEHFAARRDFALADSTPIAGQPLRQVLDATDPDLTRFKRHGGKLILYFGWDDPVLSPRAALDYYRRVIARMGGMRATRGFFRVFAVPGMSHCQGGPGATAFGQAPTAPALREDREHSIRRALEAWVEQGIAPERLMAAKYVGDDPKKGVRAMRALCAYPDIASGSRCLRRHSP